MVFIKHGSLSSSSRPDCAPRYWFQQGINKISDGTGGHHRMCFGLFFLTFITGSILFLPLEVGGVPVCFAAGWKPNTPLAVAPRYVAVRTLQTLHPMRRGRREAARCPSAGGRRRHLRGFYDAAPRSHYNATAGFKDAALCSTSCFICMARSFL